MKITATHWIGSLALVAACGGKDRPAATTPSVATDECEGVANHIVDLNASRSRHARPALVSRLSTACRQDAWSADVRTCLLGLADDEADVVGGCREVLSEEQLDHLYLAFLDLSDDESSDAEPAVAESAGNFRCNFFLEHFNASQMGDGTFLGVLWRADGAGWRIESEKEPGFGMVGLEGACTTSSCELRVYGGGLSEYWTGTYWDKTRDVGPVHHFTGTWGDSADDRTNGGPWEGFADCKALDP